MVPYVVDLIQTKDLLNQLGVDVVIELCRNDSLVTRARNNLLAKAMTSVTMTHMIFIDADLHWNPTSISQLLLANRDVVGGAYPLKRYNWKSLIDPSFVPTCIKRHSESLVSKMTTPLEYLKNQLVNYNVNFMSDTMDVVDSMVEVKHLPTGFLLLRRNAVKALQEAMPETKYRDDVGYLSEAENANAFALFDTGVVEGHYYSEDWMFCHRWKNKCGGAIYLHLSVPLVHSGLEDYSGFVLSSLS